MKLRYLTPLVLALVSGVAWSVQSYLEADRALRVELRLQKAELPCSRPLEAVRLPTARVLTPSETERAPS